MGTPAANSDDGERLRALTWASGQLPLYADVHGALLSSPEWQLLTGQTAEEMVGNGWLSAVDEADRERVSDTWQHTIAAGKVPLDVAFALKCADGDTRQARVRMAPVQGEGGRVSEWLGLLAVVTSSSGAQATSEIGWLVAERARLHEQAATLEQRIRSLQLTNSRMDEFLSLVCHELKSPMTTIKLSLQSATRRLRKLANDPAAPPPFRERLLDTGEMMQMTDRQVARLVRLVNDLLDISRIRTGRLQLVPTLVDIAAITREAAIAMQEAEPDRAIELDLPSEPVVAMADTDRIAQVVTNYLTNAIKYAPPPDPIRVEVTTTPDTVRVSVIDHGPGIADDEQVRIWERFEQGDTAPAQPHTGAGLGLGLHISRGIITGLGGTIGVTSTPGEGATFWFALPLAPRGSSTGGTASTAGGGGC